MIDFRQLVRERVRACNLDPAREAEIVDEISQHMCDRYESLLRSGVAADEAARRIAAEFTQRDLAHELRATEHVWKDPVALGADKGENFLVGVWQDTRYAVRSLRKTPLLALVVIASLALGIGANTAIFSLMDAVMLRFLPVPHPEELVKLQRQDPGEPPSDTSFTNAMWEATRDQQNVFSGVFASSSVQQIDLARGGAVQYINGVFVSGGYFSTLGLNPAAGRLISTTDDHRGCAPIAVLSYAFWQSHFGETETAVGSTISLRGHPFEIVGVGPARFHGIEVGKSFDVAMPLCASEPFDQRNLDSRGRWWLEVMGRVKPGLNLEQVRSGLAVISPGVMSAAVPPGNPAYQKRFLQRKLFAAPAGAGNSELRSTFRDPLRVLMAIVALVLLIACANITSLMLARMTVRRKEIAIRKALGASRSRLARQLITESVLLSLLGAAGGMIFAKWGSSILVGTLSTGRNRLFLDLSPDRNVLLFTLAIAVITGVLMGTLPALRSTRVEIAEAMKPRTSIGREHQRFRLSWIVAGQVALSLVLLVGGALLLRTFVKLMTLDLGFDRNNVLVVSVRPPWWAHDDVKMAPEQRINVDRQIEGRLRALPGVASVSRSFIEPLGDDNWMDQIQSDIAPATKRHESVYFNFVTPEYLGTLRIPLQAGRNFNDGDAANSQRVAIINETLAHSYFPGVNPVGHRMQSTVYDKPMWIEIVGVMKDSKYETVQEKTHPTVFLPAAQGPVQTPIEQYELRTAVTPESLIPAVQHAVADVNPRDPVEFHTLQEHVDDSLAQQRLMAMLAGFFGVLALVLAMIGLYGVLSYGVNQRQAEFGIRMALGARPTAILRLVMGEVGVVLAVGVGVGIAISIAAGSLLKKLLFGLAPHDPLTMTGSVCLLTIAALVAGYLPARRATRADPMVTLRYE